MRWQAVLLAALLALPALAADFELTALMEMLALVPAAKDSFTETKHSAVLSTPLVLKGTLSADKARLLARIRLALEQTDAPQLRPAWTSGL